MGTRGPRRCSTARSTIAHALTAAGLALAALLLLTTAATAAVADDPGQSEPPPTEPVATDPPPAEPDPTDPPPEPTPDPPVVVLPEVDTQQPPADVPVLPRRCVPSGGTMPARAQACVVRHAGKRRPLVVTWGDSHSWQQTRGISRAAAVNREALVTFQLGACPPMVLDRWIRTECAKLGRAAIAFIRQQSRRRPVRVVLGGYWYGYLNPASESPYIQQQAALFRRGGPRAFEALAALAERRDVRTVGIGQQPTLGGGVAVPALDLPRAQVLPDEARIAAWLRARVDEVVDPSRLLCNGLWCRSSVERRSVYSDSLHLDPRLSDRLAGEYRRALRVR